MDPEQSLQRWTSQLLYALQLQTQYGDLVRVLFTPRRRQPSAVLTSPPPGSYIRACIFLFEFVG